MLLVIVFMLAACGGLGDRPGMKLTMITAKRRTKVIQNIHDGANKMLGLAYSASDRLKDGAVDKNPFVRVQMAPDFFAPAFSDGVCLIWREGHNMVVKTQDAYLKVTHADTFGPPWGHRAYSLTDSKSPDVVLIQLCSQKLYSQLQHKQKQNNGLFLSDILSAMRETGSAVSEHDSPDSESFVLDLTSKSSVLELTDKNLRFLYFTAWDTASATRLFDAGQGAAVASATDGARRQLPTLATVLAWSGLFAMLAMLGAVSFVRFRRAKQISAAVVEGTVGHFMQEDGSEAKTDGATGFAWNLVPSKHYLS